MEPEKPKPGLSPAPGLRRGDAVCSVTWERPHPSTLPPLPRAAVGSSTKGQEANCKQSGEGITRPGVWPHASEAMNFPTPALKGREGVGEEKVPSNGDNSQHLRAPLPKPGARPYTYLCFPLSPDGTSGRAVQGILALDHCLLPSLRHISLLPTV